MILAGNCGSRSTTWYRASILLVACGLFVLSLFSGRPLKVLEAQTTSASGQETASGGWISPLFEEFPRSLSPEERTKVAEKFAEAAVIALNYENDSTCPLGITRATARSVEISRQTEETPLYVIALSFRVANSTNRKIDSLVCSLSRTGTRIKEVPLRLFRSVAPSGSREFSIPSSVSPENLRYLPIILKERPERLILKIDGVAFEGGTSWGTVPEVPTAPSGVR